MQKPQTQIPPDAYERLKLHGHSAAKAAEIVLDAKRGDARALKWIDLIRSFAQ